MAPELERLKHNIETFCAKDCGDVTKADLEEVYNQGMEIVETIGVLEIKILWKIRQLRAHWFYLHSVQRMEKLVQERDEFRRLMMGEVVLVNEDEFDGKNEGVRQ